MGRKPGAYVIIPGLTGQGLVRSCEQNESLKFDELINRSQKAG